MKTKSYDFIGDNVFLRKVASFPDKRDSSFPARLLTFDLVEHRKHQSLLGRYTKDNFKACSDNRTNLPTVSGVRNNASLKSWHFATPPTVSSRNDVWGTTAEITYWWCCCASDWLKIYFTVGRVAKCRLSCRARQTSPRANYTLKNQRKNYKY